MLHLYYSSKYDILRVGVPNNNLLYGEEKYIKYVLTDDWVLIDDKFEDNTTPVCPIVAIADNRLYFVDSNGKLNEIERNY